MITFLATLFALGTFWFWLLLFIDFVVITALVEHEEGWWATITALATIIGLNYLWKLPVFKTIVSNPGHVALLVAVYFAAGAAWSLVKWLIFLHKKSFAYQDFKADFLSKNNAKELTPALASKLMESIEEANRYKDSEKKITANPPSAREYYNTLTRWATYWPFSIVGTLLSDVVSKSIRYMVRLLQSTYQRMSNYVFRNAAKDVELAKSYKASAGNK